MDPIGLTILIAAGAAIIGVVLYLVIDGRRLRLPPHSSKYTFSRSGLSVTVLVAPGASVNNEGMALAHDALVSVEALIEVMAGGPLCPPAFVGRWTLDYLKERLGTFFVYVKHDDVFDRSSMRGANAYLVWVKGLIGRGEPMAVIRQSRLNERFPALVVHEALHAVVGDNMHSVRSYWFDDNGTGKLSIETVAKSLARSRL